MSVEITRSGATVTLSIGERLDYSSHQEFRRAYEGVEGVSEYIVNMTDTKYVDSSALGMLLLLREASPPNVTIRIVHCGPTVQKILRIANLQKMFSIS